MLDANPADPAKDRRRRLPPQLAAALAWLKGKSSPWAVSLVVHGALLVLLSLIAVRSRLEPALSIDTRWSSDADSDLEFVALPDDLDLDDPPDELPEPVMPQPLSELSIQQPSMRAPLSPSSAELDLSGLAPISISSAPVDLSGHALAGRSGERKQALLRRFGGNENTEKSVELGLRWLARHQAADGNWSLDFRPMCSRRPCTEPGNLQSDTAATGLALLPFLGAGHTHQSGEHQALVRRGIDWLISRQQPDGNLSPAGSGQARLYAHGIATIALCEAYAITKDQELRWPAQRALGYIADAQHESLGGWRYAPRQDSDTSVFGWQLMALQSGRTAGLEVSGRTLTAAEGWLDAVANEDGSRYAYRPRMPTTLTMTAEALLCRQYLGWQRDHPALLAGAAWLTENLPTARKRNVYGWYYGTQVMYHLQGDGWEAWNEAVTQTLLKTQVTRGRMAGSWNARQPTPDAWGAPGGRLYMTSLSLLILEVYYRHLPLYRELGG